MAENNQSDTEHVDQQGPETKAARPSDSNNRPKPAKSDRARNRLKKRVSPAVIAVSVVLLAVIAIAGTGYVGWQWLQQSLVSLQQQNQQLAQELETSAARIRQFESFTERTDDQWRSAVSELETLVVESAQRWNAQSDRTENRWPLEEALTLTRLAAQRLQLDADADIAVRMLRSADAILAELDQAAVLPLRRQLAKDILALESTESADVNGLYFQLDAVSERLRALKWQPEPETQTPVPEEADPAEGFWHSLKNVVVISRLDVPMEAPALLSDFERWRQHTLMLLEQTQLALLAGNQPLFDSALQQSREQMELMRSQFDLTALEASLAEIREAVLNPQWPDIDASIDAIETYLAGPEQDPASSDTGNTQTSVQEDDA